MGWLPFEKARARIRKLGLSSAIEWYEWSKSARPDNIPSNPGVTYAEHWQGWRDWLGTEWLPFEEARVHIRKLGLSSQQEYHAWSKSSRPNNIPSNPDAIYTEHWRGWGDWLGTGNTKNKYKLPFEEARIYVRELKLSSMQKYHTWAKTSRPNNIPYHPDRAYAEHWQGWRDWLGTTCKKQNK